MEVQEQPAAAQQDNRTQFEQNYDAFKKARDRARELQSAVARQAAKIADEEKVLKELEQDHQRARRNAEHYRALLPDLLSKDISNW